ncbi:MAG: fatty acid desaturase [Myxococcota bacterium]
MSAIRRDDWRGVAIAVTVFVLWAFSLTALLVVPLEGTMWLVAPFAVLWLAWLFTGLFITAHDAMHGSVAPGRTRLNHAIGTVALLAYAMMDYRALKRAHGHHHATPAREGDPDWHDGSNPQVMPWFWAFMMRYLTWGQWIRLVFVFWSLYLIVPTENLLLFWALPSVLSTFQLFYFGTYLPHREPEGGHDNEHHARSGRYGDLVSLVTCFHFGGCHLEHHLEPGLPWWRLPGVRRRRRAAA